jgi:pseudouridine synthase
VAGGLLYVMLHKPRRVVSTAHDPEGRRTVTDMVSIEGAQGPVRLFPVGRLDAETSGLILLTNDGTLTHRLTHARFGVTKEYLVALKGLVREADLALLRKWLQPAARSGIVRPAQPARGANRPAHPAGKSGPFEPSVVEQTRVVHQESGDRTVLRLTLQEGQHRELHLMLLRLGLKVHRLRRVGIGPIKLKGLGSGNWRFLTPVEVRALKGAVGLQRPAISGR